MANVGGTGSEQPTPSATADDGTDSGATEYEYRVVHEFWLPYGGIGGIWLPTATGSYASREGADVVRAAIAESGGVYRGLRVQRRPSIAWEDVDA